jgi:hypothetical protein
MHDADYLSMSEGATLSIISTDDKLLEKQRVTLIPRLARNFSRQLQDRYSRLLFRQKFY